MHGLDDSRLIRGFGALLGRSRRDKAGLLVYIDEIDRRKLYLGLGHSSLFACCLERFHMSESQVGKSIQAARTARRFPMLFGMVASGEMHLSGINRIAAHLSAENQADVLARARHKTIRQIKELIAEIAPRPDVPTRIRALPQRPTAPAEARAIALEPLAAAASAERAPAAVTSAATPNATAAEHAPAPVMRGATAAGAAAEHAPTPVTAPTAPGPATRVTPLSPRRYKVELTVGQETHDKLRALQALMPGVDAAAILDRAVGELLERTLARKAAVTKRPRPASAKQSKRGRGIPAAVRRDVWQRDGGRCTFVGCDGRRCDATHGLEFHHKNPYALGGEHSVGNVELRCRAHNQHEADLLYGNEFMDGKRRGDHSREFLTPYLASVGLPTPRVPAGMGRFIGGRSTNYAAGGG